MTEGGLVMKRIIISMILCISINCIAQINNDLIIEQIERMSENSGEEDNDYSELIESYWDMTENPVNINSDDIDILAEMKLISIFQLECIKNYRETYGDYKFIEELYEVEGLDNNSIEIIKNLVCFEYNNNIRLHFGDIFRYGKNKILFEINQCLNEKKGYMDIEDSILYQKPNSVYLGSPQKIYMRYNYNYKDRIEAGLVAEKDPGEYIFKNHINDSIRKSLGDHCYSDFDFFSFHIYCHKFGFLEALAIGDYKISFGQGLTMGSGMSFTSNGSSLMRRNKKISASKSANEAYYLRGIATTLKYNNLELSVFYSNKKSDANVISYDTLSDTPLEITSLQQSGLHRTYNEIMDRNAIKQQLYGCNISFRKADFQIGYTLHRTHLSASMMPENNIYNLFYFRGKNLTNHGLDFYYIMKKALLFGEAAMSDNNGMAGLIGMTIQAAGYIEFTVLYRNYAKDYQCLYSNAYASGSKNRNEEGWYFSSAISIAANWKLINSIDLHKSDWLKNNTYSPSHGYDLDSQLNYQANKNTLLYIAYRNRYKMKNTNREDIFQKYLTPEKNNMIRFHIAFQITDDLTLKNRVEYHFNKYENDKSKSYLIYQDILYNPIGRAYSIAFRYELFNAENGSVYAYENDVLYAFAVGGLSGKGIRTYLVAKLKFPSLIQISGKIGFTFYDDKHEIGSGLETIYDNWKSDAKLQLVWSF